MLFLIILFLPTFYCSYLGSLGHLKCNIPKYYVKDDIHLYPKQYFGACDKLKQMVFCSMPLAEYYIKHCKLNNHKCKCEEIFKKILKNKIDIHEKDVKNTVDFYSDSILDDGTPPILSDISANDYFYGDY
uniref:Plasmodium vivax Vir protein n=1 Tax=Strongyloides stercoralis TaxID=6248 RepID=A0A0K0EIK3_STRER